MLKKILLTSFTVWKAHHRSNSSDELLEIIGGVHPSPLHYLRCLPVDFQQAPQLVLARLGELLPDVTILCGMAEERDRLHLESRAVVGDEIVTTGVDLDALTAGLAMTEISHDAGRFVCNELYYRVLKYHREQALAQPCVFAHVPLLTDGNRDPILGDFRTIIDRLSAPLPQSGRLLEPVAGG